MEKPDNTKEQFIQVIDTLRDSLAEMERLQAERTKAVDEALRLSKFPSENPNPVLRIAKNGTVIYANDASASLLAYWGCKVNDKLPLDWRKKIIAAIKANAPVTVDVEYQDVVLSLTLAPVSDLAQVNIYGLDITERKRAEEALRKSEEQYRTLVETMTDGLGIQNEHGIFTYVNNRLCEMWGYSRDEIVGHSVTAFLDESNRDILKEQIERRRKGSQEAYELEWIGKDGRTIPTLMSPAPLWDVEGNYAGSFAVMTDITERKRMEEDLRRVQNLESLGLLAGGIAHDFNNIP